MKILFCTNDSSFQPTAEPYGYFESLRELDHSAEVFYYRKKSFFYSNFRRQWVSWMNRQLVEKCVRESFDLLVVHRGGYVAAEAIQQIRRESECRCVCIFPDNPFGSYTPPLSFDLIAAYDVFFTKDAYFEEEFGMYGAGNVVALPHAYGRPDFDADYTEEELAPYRADVAFFGSHHGFREPFFSGLTDKGVEFKIWGPRWEAAKDPWIVRRVMGRGVYGEEKAKVLRATKIVINIQHGGGAVFWPDDRTFQIAGSGALAIVNDKKGIEDVFEAGREILTYTTKEELRELIRKYLADDEARLEIARRGQERARRDHTTTVRFGQILGILKERGITLPEN
jgi:hypothetical protein